MSIARLRIAAALALASCLAGCVLLRDRPEHHDKPLPKTAKTAKPAPSPSPVVTAKPPPVPKGPVTVGLETPPDVAEAPADATREDNGLATKVLRNGTGTEHPGANDLVLVHYTGWTTDGKRFDSSVAREKPASFAVNGVIPGWQSALPLFVVGEVRRLWIPSELAYGDTPPRPNMPAGDLVFDVELLEIKKAPPVPEDLVNPTGAKATRSGLRYRVLQKGKSRVRPKHTDQVEVEYSGWTLDGRMFDSTTRRGEPGRFILDEIIPGLREGIPLMSPGDRFRLWIPEDLAFAGKKASPGTPQGDLVFDIELIRIVPPEEEEEEEEEE
jgi:FKBP-type peptidyl-prolyl cis-trans isomerase